MTTRAYIGLGSNLGDRRQALQRALEFLAGLSESRLVGVSSLYETRPVGPVAQGDFLNAVAALDTSLSPEELLTRLLAYEREAGRVREVRWGPRGIDLDLLIFGQEVRETAFLRLPHPELTHRAFVLVPLAELEPALVPVGSQTSVASLCEGRPDLAEVVKVGRLDVPGLARGG